MLRRLVLSLGVALAVAGGARAEDSLQDGAPAEGSIAPGSILDRSEGADLVLVSGDRLIDVEILTIDDQAVHFRHKLFGELTIPRDQVVAIYAIEPFSEPKAPPAHALQEPTPAARPGTNSTRPPAPEPEPPRVPWKTSLEFGITGSAGLTQALNGRGALSITREAPEMVTKLSARYRYRTNDGDVSANDFIANFRNDWILPDDPWGFFIDANAEYNQFRQYDVRIAGTGGVRYEVLKNEDTFILARAGLGAAREFGGDNDGVYPEATLGLRASHRLNSRLSLNAYGDYQPDLEDASNFRVVAGAALEIALNHDKSMKLKAGFEDTFESQSGNTNPNDIDYYLTLVLSF